jgi:hypothetical protein
MTKSEAIRRAGGATELGKLLGITSSAVRQWSDDRDIPELQRYKLKELRPWWFRKLSTKQDNQSTQDASA